MEVVIEVEETLIIAVEVEGNEMKMSDRDKRFRRKEECQERKKKRERRDQKTCTKMYKIYQSVSKLFIVILIFFYLLNIAIILQID